MHRSMFKATLVAAAMLALAACERIAARGFGRVFWDGPAWRFSSSSEQRKAAIAWLHSDAA